MSWDSTNKIITDPVDMDDIRTALVKSSGDLGTLCKYHVDAVTASSKRGINKWAKYKPVIYAKKSTMDQLNDDKTWQDIDDYALGDVPWWRATDGKCGFTINTYNTGATLVAAYNAGTDWVYTPPTGGSSAPYRQTDFNKYVHNLSYLPVYVSISGVYSESEDCWVYFIGSNGSVNIHFTFSNINDNLLKMHDFVNTGHGGVWSYTTTNALYCGVVFSIGREATEYDSCNKLWFTNSNAIGVDATDTTTGSGKWERTISIPQTYLSRLIESNIYIRAYPYLAVTDSYQCSDLSTTDAGFGTNGVIPCPVDNIASLYVKTASSSAVGSLTSCTVTRNTQNFTFVVSFSYLVTVTGGASFTANNAEIFLCQTSPDTSESYSGDKYSGFPVLTNRIQRSGQPLINAGTAYSESGIVFQIPYTINLYVDVFGNELTKVRFCMILDNGNAGAVNEEVVIS